MYNLFTLPDTAFPIPAQKSRDKVYILLQKGKLLEKGHFH